MDDSAELGLVFRVLADPTRRRVLDLLRQGPQTTGELAAAFPRLSRFAVMKHLKQLEEAHLLLVRRRGRSRVNHLNAVPLRQIEERWLGAFRAAWASGLLRLKHSVESAAADGTPQNTGEKAMPVSTILNNAFHIELEVGIDAAPGRVYDALTGDIAAWWGAPYLCDAEQATAITLEATVGGRLFERWGDEGGALWGIVTRVKQGTHLRIEGSMGLQDPVAAVVDFELEERDGGKTLLRMYHKAVGDMSEETARGYQGGWQELLGERLKRFVEKGEQSGLTG
jgi:DNA-binding transcriptional ArsR family regulator/uncharacterized protein YndB with AHSA1/START domain